ncbi:hypothetical protein CBL_11748 [Carabus blaptoides fortunei]
MPVSGKRRRLSNAAVENRRLSSEDSPRDGVFEKSNITTIVSTICSLPYEMSAHLNVQLYPNTNSVNVHVCNYRQQCLRKYVYQTYIRLISPKCPSDILPEANSDIWHSISSTPPRMSSRKKMMTEGKGKEGFDKLLPTGYANDTIVE